MTSVNTILKYLEDANKEFDEDQHDMPQRAKKRRLDHLSWEEKIQRKKLKNRVAAQTSRDRKKAKMEQMEQAVQQLFAQNETLLTEMHELRHSNSILSKENAELRARLSAPCSACTEQRSKHQNSNTDSSDRPSMMTRGVVVERETPQHGSTESCFDLRPKGGVTRSAAVPTNQKEEASTLLVLKLVLSCLLYRTCSTSSIRTSTLTRWSDSRRVCSGISPGTWRTLLRSQIVKNQRALCKESWWGSRRHNWNPPQKA